MSALTNRIFRNVVAAPALALATAAAAFSPAAVAAQERPVAAQPVAANANVQAQRVAWQTLDRRSSTVRGTQGSAAEASRDKIAIVVWGGNVEIQRQAFEAAQDLRDEGIPLAFIVGPSQLPTENAAMIEIYGRGVSATQMMVGQERVAELRGGLRAEGQAAYGRMFPRELAALDIR
jgi:hypothetical protein